MSNAILLRPAVTQITICQCPFTVRLIQVECTEVLTRWFVCAELLHIAGITTLHTAGASSPLGPSSSVEQRSLTGGGGSGDEPVRHASDILDSASFELKLDKSNILMLGPTGTGFYRICCDTGGIPCPWKCFKSHIFYSSILKKLESLVGTGSRCEKFEDKKIPLICSRWRRLVSGIGNMPSHFLVLATLIVLEKYQCW